MKSLKVRGFVDIVPVYKAGDPPCEEPEGYLNRAEWARVQLAAGLTQRQCPHCYLWNFPQERGATDVCLACEVELARLAEEELGQ